MPELPEVETIARTLQPQILERRIERAILFNPGTLQGEIGLEVARGCVVSGVGRRGKLLLLRFTPAAEPVESLAFHLKMTGRLLVHALDTPPGPHTRAIFDLDDGKRLFFDDCRKFGYIRIMTRESAAAWPFWCNLGPEPLEIGAPDFVALFAGRRGQIKALLLDQTVIAGIGNIYADESLFRAGIAPASPADGLSGERLQRLHAALREVLLESIAACGSSIRDYRTAHGDVGAFQNRFRVYGRSGKPCVNCGAKLNSSRVAGRTTVFCPRCQKAVKA